MPKRLWKIALKRHYELPSRRCWRTRQSRSADKNYTRSKCVGFDTAHSLSHFCPHRPSPTSRKPSRDNSIQKSFPTCTSGPVFTITLRLLEGVINCDRKGRMRLLREPVHRARHPFQEERLGIPFSTVTIRCSNKLFCFRRRNGTKQIGKHASHRSA